MSNITAYHRPATTAEAFALLHRDIPTRVLGGGSQLVPERAETGFEVVDLQLLGLSGVCVEASRLHLGAMCTLEMLSQCSDLSVGLRSIIHRELPSTLRTIATLGGVVAGGSWESEVLAALLVHDAIVRVATVAQTVEVPLASLLDDTALNNGAMLQHAIILSLSIDPSGITVSERTIRTGMDTAIVAVVGRKDSSNTVRMAATGVGTRPCELNASLPTSGLQPPTDFRGTASYRTELVSVLSQRVRSGLA
jgi:CO/xanthine dehydrogenase FAD-binding subunit